MPGLGFSGLSGRFIHLHGHEAPFAECLLEGELEIALVAPSIEAHLPPRELGRDLVQTRHSHEGSGMLGTELCRQFDSVFHQPAHALRIHLPVKLVMKHLKLGQTREGGCEQATLLGVCQKRFMTSLYWAGMQKRSCLTFPFSAMNPVCCLAFRLESRSTQRHTRREMSEKLFWAVWRVFGVRSGHGLAPARCSHLR